MHGGDVANPVLDRQWSDQATDGTQLTDAGPVVAPASPTTDRVMTISGTIRITGLLLGIVIAFGAWGWTLVTPGQGWPAWLWVVIIASFVGAIVMVFRPQLSPLLAPAYAAGMGLALGGISRVYEAAFSGIVLQAVLATAVVFIVMLVLYVTRTIRVTERMRGVVIGATLGIAVFYLASFVLALFGASVPLVWDTGLFGILFSAAVIVVAAFNLMLDFDVIERGAAASAPPYMEWYAAFGLMVTIIWLYLEMLRLLGKIRS